MARPPKAVEAEEPEAPAGPEGAAVEAPSTGLFSIADFSELRRADRLRLVGIGEENGIIDASGLPREELLRRLLRIRSHSPIPLTSSGVLAATKEGYGFLRGAEVGFRAETDDIYVSPSQIRRFFLRTGDKLSGIVRAPRHAERFYSFSRITSINNLDPDAARLEARNARGGQLTAVSPEQALANALQRCAMLPPFYKSDCEARVKGQGEVSGSVIGGGLVKESVTTMPKTELDAAIQAQQPMTLPAPRR